MEEEFDEVEGKNGLQVARSWGTAAQQGWIEERGEGRRRGANRDY